MSKVNDLGLAKPGSPMLKRGYTINLAPNAIAKKPATTEKPPAKPKRKKKPGKK